MVLLGKAWSLNLAILEMACFPSGLPGAALAQLAAIVNQPSKQTYSDRDAFTGSDREMNKNLTELQRFWEKIASQQLQFFFQKNGSPNFVLPQKRTLQTIHEFQNNLEKIATIATLATNQEPTLSHAWAEVQLKASSTPCLLSLPLGDNMLLRPYVS